MWATNLEADLACSRKSAEVFSHQQANRTDCIDQAARAKFSLLGQRCAHILAHDQGTEKTRTKPQGKVLPKDKRALETASSDSSTECAEGGEVLASSALSYGSVGSDYALLQLQRTRPSFLFGEEGMAEASRVEARWLAAATWCSQVPVAGYA